MADDEKPGPGENGPNPGGVLDPAGFTLLGRAVRYVDKGGANPFVAFRPLSELLLPPRPEYPPGFEPEGAD